MIVIETEHLGKGFTVGFLGREIVALSDLCLEVQQGEVFGFLGPNGAGKTTTIKMLMGLIHPTSGTARLLGQLVDNLKMKARVGFLPETSYFYEYLTASEVLSFCAKLFKLPKERRKERVQTLLKEVGLESAAHLQLRKFSKGMLQRIGIAQALINDPELIILDEPMSGLDPIGRKQMREIILRLKAAGKTVFFSSHITHDVEMICDRVGILVQGRLLKVGSLKEILMADAGRETLEECFIRTVQGKTGQ